MPETRKKLLQQVTARIERSHEVVIAATEDTGYFSVDPAAVGRVRELFSGSAELLREIGVYFEEQVDAPDLDEIDAGDDTGFLREIGASISTELATRELADLAFMGCREILDILRHLDRAVAEHNFWKVVAHADAGIGRVRRALIPIESAMREFEGLPAKRRRWENLEDSLEIRRQYGMLWRAARRAGDPHGSELFVAARKIGQRIAILRRLKIYPFLRIDDRLAIRRLQKRIFAFLEAPRDQAGRRLWDDLVGFFGLLRQVNNRQELCEHDRRVVLTVHYQLSRKVAGADSIPAEILESLDPLLGRDDELDHVLLRPADHCCRDCLGALARLKDELAQTEAAVSQRV